MTKYIDQDSELVLWWDSERNDEPAEQVRQRDFRPRWWKCTHGHSFELQPALMRRPLICPICKRGNSSLAANDPDVAALWHPTKNDGLLPTEIRAEHGDSCWWACQAKGHAFERSPLAMRGDASCPICALEETSLAAKYPRLAQQWDPKRNGALIPEHVSPDHQMKAWWICERGHEFRRSVRGRVEGDGRCPRCYGQGWSLDKIRDFVRSLLDHLHALDPGEIYALAMQAGAFEGSGSHSFARALSTGRFPPEELERFARGEPSLVDEFANDPDFRLETQQTDEGQGEGPELDTSVTVPPRRGIGDVALGEQSSEAHDSETLPVVETKETLQAVSELAELADRETVQFLIDSALAKLWRHAFINASSAKTQAESFRGNMYAELVRDDFLAQIEEAETLEMPQGYAFRPRPDEPIAQPHLMQKHVAVRVRKDRRFGNWSGMGAGKTLSALIATRVVDAHTSLICCPNSVVDNWVKEIENAFPGAQIQSKTWTPEWSSRSDPRYLVMNYEQFQQSSSEAELSAFLEANRVDFLVIDEIHFAKQRSPATMSRRKRLLQALVAEAGKAQPELCVLGMSGTPVINELHEGKSLVELITGRAHDDLQTRPTIQNCMRLYQQLVTLGTRWCPDYSTTLNETIGPEIDCTEYLGEIRELARARGTVLELEQILTRARMPAILDALEPGQKTLIYTHYVEGITGLLREAITTAGYRVGMYTGQTGGEGLEDFMNPSGSTDVLIASSRVSTGVDGLQHVCNKLIINVLPWTRAEYEQLRGRLWRQGSTFESVEVIIPVTYANVGGERWSYCESKLDRLAYKKSIADAAVDGVVPEGNLRTPAQAQQDILAWLERLQDGEHPSPDRPIIEVPLSSDPGQVTRRQTRYGDFSRVNNRWNQSSSQTTHDRLQENPEEWAHYHTMYRQARESWEVVPFEEEIRWLEPREGLRVGDFGCGEALLASAVGDRHKVISLDHVAINEDVLACDLSEVPLGDGSLDVAIFSLSLMGANFTEYLCEAHRCLKLDGWLHVWEATSRFGDVAKFCSDLGRLGFDVMAPRHEGTFTNIRAVKTTRPPATLKLSFGSSSAT